ncbi:MAG: xanthine dehydrogenase family protein molybdopterin-binding subunit [Thermodesulfobacteriota bacterium]
MASGTYIGQRIPRLDAESKVTGATKYAADIVLPGLCHGKILFSRHPRALVKKIVPGPAARVPGVVKIITAEDMPGTNMYGYELQHHPVLVPPGRETRFIGDSLAFVVAESEAAALEARDLIEVEYEVRPPLTAPRQALAETGYRIHADAEANVACARRMISGDVEAGFGESDLVIEETYFTARQEQAFLETEAGVAWMDDARVLHIKSCLQDPYAVMEDVSKALAIPKSRVHVKGTLVGGAFGGKLDTTMQVHLAAMAYLSGVPVRLVFDRRESFIFHPKRHPTEIRVKIGAKKDGRIQALEAEVISDAGPYHGRSAEVLGLTVSAMAGPYRHTNIKLTGRAVYTNNLDSGAFRGFGAPQAGFARERAFDRLAQALNMDPLELRRVNFLQPGESPISPMLGDSPVSLEQLRTRLIEHVGPPLEQPSDQRRRVGRGLCFDMPVFDVSAIPVLGKSGVGIAVELFSDASACVYAGGTELGQGIQTILAQMAAEELGLEVNKVMVELSDTATCPRSGRTSASRLTYVLGNALRLAAEKIRRTVLEQAEKMMEVSRRDLELREGRIYVRGTPGSRMDLAEVAAACSAGGLNLREEGWFKYPENRYMYGHTFMATAAEVEVDLVTGEVKIRKLINVHDSGRVINPTLARGQLLGGAMQALGYALMEEMDVVDGRVKTRSLAEYPVPTSLDVPDVFIADTLETPYQTGPYGAKGLAEHALNSTTPAIVNAIGDAAGIKINKTPVYAEDILRALKEKTPRPVERSRSDG